LDLTRPTVCAVSYLNTVPLVWGLQHGVQASMFHLTFALPSECARQLAAGETDIGIVPVAALLDGDYDVFRGTGIACHGAVRTILLISKVPFREIRSVAMDAGSRSSVMLTRILLRERYGVEPDWHTQPAELEPMLATADACLIIGDPALRLDPVALRRQGFTVADLGEEWMQLTGLPMVFAAWAGRKGILTPEREQAFVDSYRSGKANLEEIVRQESARRGVAPDLVREYLTRYIVFELGEREYAGMDRYLACVRELKLTEAVRT
jgi:chorismate dehydratase